MTQCVVKDRSIKSDTTAIIGVVLASEQIQDAAVLKKLEEEVGVPLKIFFNRMQFLAKAGQLITIPTDKITYIFVGIGETAKENLNLVERYRSALGRLYTASIKILGDEVSVYLPTAKQIGISVEELVKQAAITVHLASYQFIEYLTDESRKEKQKKTVTFCVTKQQLAQAKNGCDNGNIIGLAVNKARHWVDSPPVDLTPEFLANAGQSIAKKHGLGCTVFNEEQINKMGMGGLAGVSRGSDLDCRLLILEYTTKKKKAPTIAIVGKGITFDSGGLSLKPAKSMEDMKEDMSGAAAVIATMEAIAQLKPDSNVIGVTPISENLPNGKSLKPGDIIRFYNGKTAEVRNTDAEGRLILADALAYTVEKYKPDLMIDIATLTGACAYALGPIYTGLFTEGDDIAERLIAVGKASGDELWRLPMGDRYAKAIQSNIADICNIGNESIKAGGTTAAHFLRHFVGDTSWAHLDIAGTAYDVPDISYYRKGATGVGVRFFVELIMNYNA